VDDTDTEVSDQIVDHRTGRGIPDVLVIAPPPGLCAEDFVRKQDKAMAFATARSDRNGTFTFPQQLPKGLAYGLVVIGRNHREDLAIESALRVGARAPEKAQMNPIPLVPGYPRARSRSAEAAPLGIIRTSEGGLRTSC
jgi:hypothetical protein